MISSLVLENKVYYNHIYARSWPVSASRLICLRPGAHHVSNGFLLSLNPNPEFLTPALTRGFPEARRYQTL